MLSGAKPQKGSGGRIWFKPDCVRWIEEGKKTTTFRRRKHEGIYEVMKGSWFLARGVGLKVRLIPIAALAFGEVIANHFESEGDFEDSNEFAMWLKRVGLAKKLPLVGWLHRIEIVEAGG